MSPAALAEYYDGVRLAILDGVLRTAPDGYRASDARVLIGTIFWKQGRYGEAMRFWRRLACAPADSYLAACTPLARAIALSGAPQREEDLARQIARVLKNEQGRWWDLSDDRLRRFGYRFETY